MSELNIYQRLHNVMKEVAYVQKESKKVNNQYTFVSHDAVTAKIRPALVEHGIMSVVRVVRHSQDGNRCEADIEVDFVNIDKPEEKVTVPAFGYGIDPQDKGPGKAVSNAFKYACLKTFALETGDDPEKDMIDHKPDAEPEKSPKELHDEAFEANADSVDCIKQGIAEGNLGMAAEAWFELDDETKMALWLAPSKGGCFTTQEREVMKTTEFKQAHFGEEAA